MFKKSVNIDDKSFYSGRENMSLFGYKKWERFEGVVSRLKKNISKDFFEKNIIIEINKTTGGRPRRDVLFTYDGARELVKYCDQRKQEVIDLVEYLDKKDDVFTSDNNINNNDKILIYNIRKTYIFFIGLFVFIAILFYLILLNFSLIYQSLFPNYKDDIITNSIIEEVEDFVDVNNDDELNSLDLFQVDSDGKFINSDIISYISNGGGDILFYDMSLNPRSEFTRTLTGTYLIGAFFELGNNGLYRDSCSLLNKSRCYSGISSNLYSFANFWDRTFDGYELLDVRKIQSGISGNRYCVKYKYDLKYDINRESVVETFNFTTNVVGGIEEINSRFCEKIEKNGKIIPCPFELNNYYCSF